MPTPIEGYHDGAGNKLPSVTTIISQNLGWNKQQLMHWANKMGQEGKHHREEVARAADIGTQAHELVELSIRGQEVDFSQYAKQAVTAFREYEQWAARSKVAILDAEIRLVSKRMRYGGTIDAIGEYDGGRELLDWKSSNGVYADHKIQLAAYWHLHDEHFPDTPIQRIHCCRFGKEGGFHHHSWPVEAFEAPWETFILLRALHDLKPEVEKL